MEWLSMAVKYEIDDSDYMTACITRRKQTDGSNKWTVDYGAAVLSKTEKLFIYDPMPSSRTDEHLLETRFDTKEEAYEAYLEYKIARKDNQPCE